ncbi:hypothetical protein F5H01DRAFT_340578 [Linnemannia elongata]|nr:hypothetical protein F5H01DRAFT_340578 [Linnemannia elongata]
MTWSKLDLRGQDLMTVDGFYDQWYSMVVRVCLALNVIHQKNRGIKRVKIVQGQGQAHVYAFTLSVGFCLFVCVCVCGRAFLCLFEKNGEPRKGHFFIMWRGMSILLLPREVIERVRGMWGRRKKRKG